MDIIKDILSEEEVLDMDVDTLSKLFKIFNMNMKQTLSEYADNQDSNKAVVAKINESFGDDLTKSTFHFKVKGKDIQGMLRDGSLRNLPTLAYNHEIDLGEFIEALDWLSANEHYLTAQMPARSKDEYEAALKAVTIFQHDSTLHHDHDLPTLLTVYKEVLFCPTREKPQTTGIRYLAANKDSWRMQKRAAEYLKYCIDNGISAINAREC